MKRILFFPYQRRCGREPEDNQTASTGYPLPAPAAAIDKMERITADRFLVFVSGPVLSTL
jgi:hypothetical protein